MPQADARRGISFARLMLSSFHLGVATVCIIRPHVTELVAGYRDFNLISNTTGWGIAAAIIGAGLFFIPRGRPILILWQFASAVYFLLFSILVTTGPAGLNFGTAMYGLPGLWSMWLTYYTADDWFWQTKWPQRMRARLEHWWSTRGHS